MDFNEWAETEEGKHAAANVIYNGSWGTAKIAYEAGQRNPLPLSNEALTEQAEIKKIVSLANAYCLTKDYTIHKRLELACKSWRARNTSRRKKAGRVAA